MEITQAEKQARAKRRFNITILVIIVLIAGIIIISKKMNKNDAEIIETEMSAVPLERINQIVAEYGEFEITAWDLDGNFITDTTNMFYIIINSSPNYFSNCQKAKSVLYQIMKSLYTDPILKTKILRIQFTAWGYLKACLGQSDAKDLDWDSFAHTIFWNVLQQHKNYEDNDSPHILRTWGVSINSDCN